MVIKNWIRKVLELSYTSIEEGFTGFVGPTPQGGKTAWFSMVKVEKNRSLEHQIEAILWAVLTASVNCQNAVTRAV